ncbi:DUF6249 domain-containing protein [Phocaeicola faecalis]
MMDFIMVPAILAIITLGIYKLFELFVCKKERLTIIEKMGEKFTPDMLEHKINFSSISNFSFSALKLGCLFTGMGLGLLLGYVICASTIPGYITGDKLTYYQRSISELIYGASVLLLGGVGLLVAFIVELNMNKK